MKIISNISLIQECSSTVIAIIFYLSFIEFIACRT